MKISLKLVQVFIIASACLLQACSTSAVGPSLSNGYKYGTGPNKTQPMPQTEKVNIQGIGGAKPRYESQRTGGCNKDYKVLGKNYMVWNGASSYIEEGTASWYGPGFHGNKTSNGEIYNQKGFTAAHKNLPLPAYLKVTNLRNGKKVIVRVNDRGPFVGDRILDLSEGSARAIDMVGTGTAKVRIELIKVNSNGSYANAVGTPTGSTSSYAQNAVTQSVSQAVTQIKTTSKYTHIGATTSRSVTPSSTSSSSSSFVNGWYVQIVACNSDLMASEIRDNVRTKTANPVTIYTQGNINKVLVGPLTESQARGVSNTLKKKGFTDCFVKRF